MNEIKIIEKPDWISWDDIHELLVEAHKRNIKKGIINQYVQLPGKEIRKIIGEDGRCWIALDGDKLIGTTSVCFFNGHSWWNKGKIVAHSCFTGILQQYQGIGLIEQLDSRLLNYVRDKRVELIQGDTAECNFAMRKLVELGGYKTVEFFATKSHHYSVRFVKWLGHCPFSDNYILRRFKISEKLTRWRYKPGKVERSTFISFFCRAANKIVNWVY